MGILHKIKLKFKKRYLQLRWQLWHRHQPKVFCIGFNKTGTTSLEFALRQFGFKMGHQPTAELLIKDYAGKNWKPILAYCKSAQAFQDLPFSLPGTWRVLSEKYPNARFILSVRDEEKWYTSITKFHSQMFADGVRIPTHQDLKNAIYRYPGFMWETFQAVWPTPQEDLYNKEIMISVYRKHNQEVIEAFVNKPNFLAMDASETDSYHKLATFLNKKPLHLNFPHLNKSVE